MLSATAGTGLLHVVISEHTEDRRTARLQAYVHNAVCSCLAHEIEVRCFATDYAADTDHAVQWVMLKQELRSQCQLKAAGHVFLNNVFQCNAVLQ